MPTSQHSIAHRPLCASDCALAVSLPLSDADYKTWLREQRDFAKVQTQPISKIAPFLDMLKETCILAEKSKIAVRCNATQIDLKELLTTYPVVLFVSHMRLQDITQEDLVDAPDACRQLTHPQNLLQVDLRAEIDDLLTQPPTGLQVDHLRAEMNRVAPMPLTAAHSIHRPSSDAVEELVAGLQRIHSNAARWYSSKNYDPEWLQTQQPESVLRRMTRLEIEDALCPALRAGVCVEFADRIQPISALIDAIPSANELADGAQERILDLSLCNSAMLAPAIKRKRPNCLLRVGRYPTDPAYSALYCRSMLAVIAESTMSFSQATKIVITTLQRHRNGS